MPDPCVGTYPQSATRRSRNALTFLADIEPVLNDAALVKGLLTQGGLSLVYGDANTGKSFLVLDLGLSIAAGRPWQGLPVHQDLVVYVACEGGNGIRNRLIALKQRYPENSSAPFALLTDTPDFSQSEDVDHLVALVTAAADRAGHRPALVVIDTLARVMGPRNENDAQDMQALLNAADRVRGETGAALMFIHHSGKQVERGPRGHSSLRAAIDTELRVDGKGNQRRVTVTKQRDLPASERFTFTLETVTIGTNPEDGCAITSCVVGRPYGAAPETGRQPRGRNQQQLYDALLASSEATRKRGFSEAELRSLSCGRGLTDRRRRAETVRGLLGLGLLKQIDGRYFVASNRPK